jgi:hypothetical protein
MLTASRRRTTILLLLAAILAVPLVSAAAPRTEAPRPVTAAAPDSLDLLDRAWSFLRKVWSKDSCNIDPNGLCSTKPAQSPAQTKEGCDIDPLGRCIR